MSDVREKQLPLNLFRGSQWICMNLQIHEVNFNCHPFAGVLPSPRFVLHLWGFCRVGKPRPALRASGIIFMWGLMYVAICVCMHVNCMYIYIYLYACKLHVCMQIACMHVYVYSYYCHQDHSCNTRNKLITIHSTHMIFADTSVQN